MQNVEMELTVGDVLLVGNYIVTVVDIDNGEVAFRVEEVDAAGDPRETPVSPK